MCERGKEILISRGSIHSISGIPYLVEPVIRYYDKFTSNTGWIGDTSEWTVRCMEAFSHYSYHRSGGQLLICDLQGRYRGGLRGKNRFELSDPAICSQTCHYGPADLGEKGIESFFAIHECNEFCQPTWARRPQGHARQWFPQTKGTTMLPSGMSPQLGLTSRATFRRNLDQIVHNMDRFAEYYDSDSNDSW